MAELDLVRREEYDALKAEVAALRQEIEALRAEVRLWTGLPVSIGLAPTKALAKLGADPKNMKAFLGGKDPKDMSAIEKLRAEKASAKTQDLDDDIPW
mgnify:CR=1 FL=1